MLRYPQLNVSVMNMSKSSLKRWFIIGIVLSLVGSALLGIAALLQGNFDGTDWKVLLTTLIVGIFSLTSLASLRSIESDSRELRLFSTLGIVTSLLAALCMACLIWSSDIFGSEMLWRVSFTLAVLAISIAHASLLVGFRKRGSTLNLLSTATLGCIATVAGMLIYLTTASQADQVGEFFYRLLGVFAILDVLGTIILPILAKFTPNPQPQSASTAGDNAELIQPTEPTPPQT